MTLAAIAILVSVSAGPGQSPGYIVLPSDSNLSWNYVGPRDTPGSTTLIYSETTSSGFFLPYTQNILTGISDDLPGAVSIFDTPGNQGPDNPEDWSITGLSFQYTLRASTSQLPVTATVRFIGIDFAGHFITAEYGKIVIPDLVTGTVIQAVTLQEKIIAPKNIWMEIQFSPVQDLAATTRTEDVGWNLATDIHSEGGPAMGNSEDIFLITNGLPAGSVFPQPWNTVAYTPTLPTTDPNYILPRNFIFDVYGKKIPEPMTLGLLLMGLTGVTAIRRRR